MGLMARSHYIFCNTPGFDRLRAIAFTFLIVLTLAGCMSGSSGGDDTGQTDTSASTGGSGGGSSSGGDSGTGSGGDSGSVPGDSSGSPGDTGGGGTSGGGTETIYGTFANLYTDNTGNLDLLNCSNPSSQNFNISSIAFGLFEQVGNNVEAAITIVPGNQDQFDQAFLRVSGAFTSEGSFSGSASIVYSLNTVILEDNSVTNIAISLIGETIIVTFSVNAELPSCGLNGILVLSVPVDSGNTGGGDTGGTGGDTGGGTGTGGTGGGDTGGDTGGGDTGGGTGTGTGGSTGGDSGTWIEAVGQFGSVQMQSVEFPDDNGTFEMTTAALMVVPGLEGYVWTNVEETTVSVFFESGNSHTQYNSANGRRYHCNCFPTVDLINNQVIFNNLEVFKPTSPTGSLIINGTLAIAQ